MSCPNCGTCLEERCPWSGRGPRYLTKLKPTRPGIDVLGRRGRQLRALLAPCREGGAVLFDEGGKRETHRIALRERTDFVWHGYLPQARPGLLYGYRVHGAYKPEEGHRFNPHKLLLDPYARSIAGPLRWSDALFGYTIGSKKEDLSLTGARMPPARPRHRWSTTLSAGARTATRATPPTGA